MIVFAKSVKYFEQRLYYSSFTCSESANFNTCEFKVNCVFLSYLTWIYPLISTVRITHIKQLYIFINFQIEYFPSQGNFILYIWIRKNESKTSFILFTGTKINWNKNKNVHRSWTQTRKSIIIGNGMFYFKYFLFCRVPFL